MTSRDGKGVSPLQKTRPAGGRAAQRSQGDEAGADRAREKTLDRQMAAESQFWVVQHRNRTRRWTVSGA